MENNWISVKDRLPEESKDYLVTDGDCCTVACFLTHSNEWDFFGAGWWDNEDVQFWQPLPEPPKQ